MQPLMIVALAALFLILESIVPDLTPHGDRRKHVLRNMGLEFINFLTNGLAGVWLAGWMLAIHQHGWGLLNALPLSPLVATIAGIIVIDFESYVGHVLFHKLPWLWRVHRVHHSDDQLDSTTSLRVHPFETILQTAWRTLTFALFGVSFASFVLFLTLVLPALFVQHANLKFPRWLERTLGAVFVFSSWHKVHHSDEQRYTDSHYGNLLTWWDRLFGTAHRGINIERLRWGLEEFRDEGDQKVLRQLLLPFSRPAGDENLSEANYGAQARRNSSGTGASFR
jgi:sterol desaturase/sphingolipid hydroxylase (fatty acid hydroxylase superfamily)